MTTKLTFAQVEVLNNAERNSSKPGRVWMSPWNDKTMRILREAGLIEWLPDSSPVEKEADEQLLDSLADRIKTATTNKAWGYVVEYGHEVVRVGHRMTAQSYYITEAGRQALISAKGGA